MIRNALATALLAFGLSAGPALAQTAGGVTVIVAGDGSGMAAAASMMALPRPPVIGPPPTRTPTSVASINPARARSATDQGLIAQIRGDPGFLAGFQKGQPLAFSRQPPPEPVFVPNFTFVDAPFIVNNFVSDVDINLADPSVTVTDPSTEGAGTDGQNTSGDGSSETIKGGIPPVLSGGIEFNNIGSTVNAVIGNANNSVQQILAPR